MAEVALPPSVEIRTLVGRLRIAQSDQVMRPWMEARGSWELGESAALAALVHPGARVVEIGAHVGYLTILMAKAAGPDGEVLAIEAHPVNHALLEQNLAVAGVSNVRAVLAAAWRENGELKLTVSSENTGDHRVYPHDGVSEQLPVRAVRVDDLVGRSRVDVVKVDAQGVDHVALAGMAKTIARCRPAILLEFWPQGIEAFGDRALDVASWCLELGYDASVLEAPALGGRATPEEIVDAATAQETGFCTLVLHPRRQDARLSRRVLGRRSR